MLYFRRLGYSHGKRYAKAVVRSEGCALGAKPFAVNPGFNRILDKIVDDVGVFLGNHVHVSLENHGLEVLVAGSCRDAHDDVAGLVGEGLDLVLRSPVEQELAYDFFVLGRAGAAGKGIEVIPHYGRL